MNWQFIELTLNWLAVLAYAISTVLLAVWGFFKKELAGRAGYLAFMAGVILQTVAIGGRWIAVGHGPYTTSYELYASNALVVMLLLAVYPVKARKALALIVVPFGMLLLMLGLAKYREIAGLPTAYHYFWLGVHVFFVKLSIGAILLALASSLYLVFRADNQAEKRRLFSSYNYRFTGLGFVFWTIATVAGAIWADLRWGRYWGWDPIETWSLIVWLGLGLNLHLQRFGRTSDRGMAWFTVGCFVLFVVTLFVVPFMGRTLHTMYVVGE